METQQPFRRAGVVVQQSSITSRYLANEHENHTSQAFRCPNSYILKELLFDSAPWDRIRNTAASAKTDVKSTAICEINTVSVATVDSQDDIPWHCPPTSLYL